MRRPYNGLTQSSRDITRPFGVVDSAYANYPNSAHPGADYGTPENHPLVAAISGTVTAYSRGNTATGRGNEVVITNGSTQVKYCHLNRIDVANGSTVTEGQQIGLCGWTGYVLPKSPAGSHLHFETLTNGVYKNPETMYITQGGDMPIPDADNYYWRYGQKLALLTRGRTLTREEFRKHIVGRTDLQAVEILSDDPEADKVQEFQQWALTNRASITKQVTDQAKQISDLNTKLTSQSLNIAELTKANEELNTRIKDLEAKLAVQSDDTQLLNGFGEFLRKMITRLGLK